MEYLGIPRVFTQQPIQSLYRQIQCILKASLGCNSTTYCTCTQLVKTSYCICNQLIFTSGQLIYQLSALIFQHTTFLSAPEFLCWKAFLTLCLAFLSTDNEYSRHHKCKYVTFCQPDSFVNVTAVAAFQLIPQYVVPIHFHQVSFAQLITCYTSLSQCGSQLVQLNSQEVCIQSSS